MWSSHLDWILDSFSRKPLTLMTQAYVQPKPSLNFHPSANSLTGVQSSPFVSLEGYPLAHSSKVMAAHPRDIPDTLVHPGCFCFLCAKSYHYLCSRSRTLSPPSCNLWRCPCYCTFDSFPHRDLHHLGISFLQWRCPCCLAPNVQSFPCSLLDVWLPPGSGACGPD